MIEELDKKKILTQKQVLGVLSYKIGLLSHLTQSIVLKSLHIIRRRRESLE